MNNMNENKHKYEIIRWACSPSNTAVWYTIKEYGDWFKTSNPSWMEDGIYIVDDKWAELRKAQADGKQLQSLITPDRFADNLLTEYLMNNTEPSNWRIKPEPVYEWQYTTRTQYGHYVMSTGFYTDDEPISDYNVWTRFEPSKRERK